MIEESVLTEVKRVFSGMTNPETGYDFMVLSVLEDTGEYVRALRQEYPTFMFCVVVVPAGPDNYVYFYDPERWIYCPYATTTVPRDVQEKCETLGLDFNNGITHLLTPR